MLAQQWHRQMRLSINSKRLFVLQRRKDHADAKTTLRDMKQPYLFSRGSAKVRT